MKKTVLRLFLKNSQQGVEIIGSDVEMKALMAKVQDLIKSKSTEALSGFFRDEKMGDRHWFVVPSEVSSAITIDWDAMEREQLRMRQEQERMQLQQMQQGRPATPQPNQYWPSHQ